MEVILTSQEINKVTVISVISNKTKYNFFICLEFFLCKVINNIKR